MVVCKFFQQGSCRYGQNCRFEHAYSSKYSYANPQSQTTSSTTTVTDEQLIDQVHSEVKAVLHGGQWILSSYAPFKEKAAFPGIIDLSPEEARLIIYEAKANNTLDQAITYMNELFKGARSKYEQLLLKNSNITRIFRSLYNGQSVSSPFGIVTQESSAFGNNSQASSVFRGAVETSPFTQNNQSPSIFTQNNATPSIFAQNNTAPSIFAHNTAPNPDPSKSIFAQANQSTFNTTNQNTSIFGIQNQNNAPIINAQPNVFAPQTDSAAKSIFAQATQNPFTSPPQGQSDPANIFATASQSIFTQNQQATPFAQSQFNVFQTPEPQNVFSMNQNVFQQVNPAESNVYSKMEDLSPTDLEAFNSEDFKIGFVPELPPPHSLCF